MDKLKQWMDIAKNMQGGDFWNNIFDQDFTKQFMNEQQMKQAADDKNESINRKENTPRPFPPYELLEGEKEVVIIIELPGVMRENLELGLNRNVLTIKGKVLPIHPQLKNAYSERYYGDFQREIPIPDIVNPSQLTAKFWNGVLLVSYPRNVEKGEQIPID